MWIRNVLHCLLQIKEATRKIASEFEITGPFNIQFLVKENDVRVSGLFLQHFGGLFSWNWFVKLGSDVPSEPIL